MGHDGDVDLTSLSSSLQILAVPASGGWSRVVSLTKSLFFASSLLRGKKILYCIFTFSAGVNVLRLDVIVSIRDGFPFLFRVFLFFV